MKFCFALETLGIFFLNIGVLDNLLICSYPVYFFTSTVYYQKKNSALKFFKYCVGPIQTEFFIIFNIIFLVNLSKQST